MPPQGWGVMTRTDDRLYLHVLETPPDPLVVPGTRGIQVERAFVFGTEREVEVTIGSGGDLELTLPADARHPIDTIIVLGL